MVFQKEGLTAEGEKSLRQLDALAVLSPKLATRIRREIGEDAVKEVESRTPRDTDSLVSTTRLEVNRFTGVVNILMGGIMAKFSRSGKSKKFVGYAQYVEEGTSRMNGFHMLVKGVDAALRKKNSIGKFAFNNWISQVKK